MAEPRVLIATRREQRKGRPIQFVGEAHCAMLLSLGALPLMTPGLETMAPHVDTLFELCDGLLLVEGGDVGPEHRGSDGGPAIGLVELDAGKDELEMTLLRRAFDEDMPVLGICRGAQLINVAYGGSLHRDIGKDVPGAIAHLSHSDYDGYRHPANLVPGTRLQELYGDTEIPVTSVHHQANRTTGGGLTIAARSPDGLVEAVEDPERRFMVGVQFHPERQRDEHPGHRALYSDFVAAVREHAEG